MNAKKLILSCFGIGFSPFAPGTLASLFTLIIFLAVHYYYPVPIIRGAVVVFMMVLFSILCLLFAGEAEKQYDVKDPGWIVIDEVAGQAMALLPAAITSQKVFVSAIGAFVLFRIFDILKPPPIREIQQLDGGLGVLIDDLVAGIMAGTVLCIITFLVTLVQLSD
ncbi:MAG: phosphatidylglycerophosphatase A [Planctomycetes bacterium HGW-Planctomycetes-1]|nr:MAG: phosphatidylglycerophosphatase A [Planctomycetes bacterium HGW-Planctomycetes-1]